MKTPSRPTRFAQIRRTNHYAILNLLHELLRRTNGLDDVYSLIARGGEHYREWLMWLGLLPEDRRYMRTPERGQKVKTSKPIFNNHGTGLIQDAKRKLEGKPSAAMPETTKGSKGGAKMAGVAKAFTAVHAVLFGWVPEPSPPRRGSAEPLIPWWRKYGYG